jgi:hypothetical protein
MTTPVVEINYRMAQPFIERWHYSHKAPTGKNVYFGWFVDGLLYAAADYGIGVNQNQEKFLSELTGLPVTKGSLYELKRLCRIEPRNSAYPLTKFLAFCHRLLRKQHGIRFIVSFSDPAHNRFEKQRSGISYESGGIYRAANFLYLGKTNTEWHVTDKDGVVRHRLFAYRYMTRHNRSLTAGQPYIDLREARNRLKLRRVITPAKDRWFLDLGVSHA